MEGRASFEWRVGAAADAMSARVIRQGRLRETLAHILLGRSEKEIADRIGISCHTVHAYVKVLYDRFHVQSRAELMATFVFRHIIDPGSRYSAPPGVKESSCRTKRIGAGTSSFPFRMAARSSTSGTCSGKKARVVHRSVSVTGRAPERT